MLCLISFKVNAVHEVNIFMNPSRKKKKTDIKWGNREYFHVIFNNWTEN